MKIVLDETVKAVQTIKRICAAIEQEGGRAFLVGGAVRDQAMAALNIIDATQANISQARDFDLECYHLAPDKLLQLLQKFARVDTVGEAFTVYKMGFGRGAERFEVDVSLPRRESKTGHGHKGFTVVGDPEMSFSEAARRRDFTINALMCDLLTGEVIDPHQGLPDLENRVLRVVDPTTFIDDSLRVLRAMQFAARFQFSVDPETIKFCRTIKLDDLPCERIWGEIEKLLLRAAKPSIGWQVGLELGVIDQLFPELKALIGCQQEPDWHPEGDVWVHTLQVIDEAAQLITGLSKPEQVTVMLAALCHDLGKPATTEFFDGRIRSHNHEEGGVAPTVAFLERINIHTMDGYHVRDQVIALVANHLKPGQFYNKQHEVTDGAFRRLARKCDMDLLYRVAKADSLGRRAEHAPPPGAEAQEWFKSRVQQLNIEHYAPEPLLMGRHLLELGLAPGRKIGEITRAIYELQLDGKIVTLEEAINAAKSLFIEH